MTYVGVYPHISSSAYASTHSLNSQGSAYDKARTLLYANQIVGGIIKEEMLRDVLAGIKNLPNSDHAATPTVSVVEAVDHGAQRPHEGDDNKNVTHPSYKPLESVSYDPVCREPGPFMFIKNLDVGTYGTAIVVRELGHPERWSSAGGRVLCLKVFNKRIILQKDLLHGVLRELEAYQRLTEACRTEGSLFVMSLEASLQDEKRLFFAMELMKCDLVTVLAGEGPDRRANARRWIAQTAAGLSAIHAAGIIHRDIKPENLLIDSRDNIRITDFGSAYIHATPGPLYSRHTYIDDVTGTWGYMAPEVLLNEGLESNKRSKYGIMVDYWALGCVAFELASDYGNVLFETIEEFDRFQGWLRTLKHDGGSLNLSGLSGDAKAVVAGLLSVVPENRFDICNLRSHPYFQNADGLSVFDNMESMALARWSVPIDVRGDVKEALVPPEIFYPQVECSRSSDTLAVFQDAGWINPRGVWSR